MLPWWQVFGLASAPSIGSRLLLSTLPNAFASVLDVEVVLAYRCGAVLASDQVPFSADVDRGLGVSTSLDM
jgi:hypothetical protein